VWIQLLSFIFPIYAVPQATRIARNFITGVGEFFLYKFVSDRCKPNIQHSTKCAVALLRLEMHCLLVLFLRPYFQG